MALKIMALKRDLEKNQERLAQLDEAIKDYEVRSREYYDEFEVLEDSDDEEALAELLKKDEKLERDREDAINERERLVSTVEQLNNDIAVLSEGKITERKITKPVENSLDVRSNFNNYLHRAEGFTSTDGSVIIPTEIIYQPRDEVFTDYDLSQFVNRVSVSTPSGTYPIQKRATAIMNTVEELAENPELAKPQFENVTYEVATYRGQIAISEESIDDAAVDLVALISRDILVQKLNTTNKLIGEVIKNFSPKEVKSIDDIKTILNVDLDPAYERRFIMTQSMYNALDQLKDYNGKYLIQREITDSTEKRLLGYPISVVRDTLLGDQGAMVAFVGDSRAAITYFDRTQFSARWIDDKIYGQLLMIGFRCDVKSVDEDAGFFITYKPDTSSSGGGPGGAPGIDGPSMIDGEAFVKVATKQQ